MKRPTSDRPSSRSIQAATDESTPPLMATTQRGEVDVADSVDMDSADANSVSRKSTDEKARNLAAERSGARVPDGGPRDAEPSDEGAILVPSSPLPPRNPR